MYFLWASLIILLRCLGLSTIIAPITNHGFPNAKYTPGFGISASEYNKGNWEGYDIYSSEDKIITDEIELAISGSAGMGLANGCGIDFHRLE